MLPVLVRLLVFLSAVSRGQNLRTVFILISPFSVLIWNSVRWLSWLYSSCELFNKLLTARIAEWMSNRWMINWKESGRNLSYPGICLESLRITTKYATQVSRCPGRDSKQEPPDCEHRAWPPDQCGSVVMKSNIFWDVTRYRALLATCSHSGTLRGLFFDPENRGNIFLRNVSWL
jgi:hypothetical protein